MASRDGAGRVELQAAELLDQSQNAVGRRLRPRSCEALLDEGETPRRREVDATR